ncbi:hypothetical protein [Okeania sp. SIO2B3]|nr:hypothetical protein [Okeania sp. SIO2B3]NET43135.1 hypothetical protein [Okeania sp. SIO2B3]
MATGENPLANLILENKFVGGDIVVINCLDGGLVFGKKEELEFVKR